MVEDMDDAQRVSFSAIPYYAMLILKIPHLKIKF